MLKKLLVALVASAFALGAYAQTPAPKAAETPKADTKVEKKKKAKAKQAKAKSDKAADTPKKDAAPAKK